MLIAAGGMAVALSIDARTLFFNYGMADVARKEPSPRTRCSISPRSARSFIATLLAQAVKQGESLARRSRREIRDRAAARRRHPQGHARPAREPHLGPHSHAQAIRAGASRALHACRLHPLSSMRGRPTRRMPPASRTSTPTPASCLLALALQRRFNTPIAQLMEVRLLAPLGMTSTALPVPRADARGSSRRSCAAARCRATIPNAQPVASRHSRAPSTGPAPRGGAAPARAARAHRRAAPAARSRSCRAGARSRTSMSCAIGVLKRRCSASASSTKPVLE